MRMLTCLLVLITSAGCSGGHQWGGGGTSEIGKTGDVDFAYTVVHESRDDAVFLILIVDGCTGSSTSRAATSGEATTIATLTAVGGRKITSKSTTRDGKSGPVEIDAQKFDLAKGGVFLINMKEQPAKVEQLAADLSKLPKTLDKQALKGLGETVPALAPFLKSCRGEK